MAKVSRTTAAEVNEYRAYTLGHDDHITASRGFVFAGDDDAIVWANQLLDDHDMELWSGARFVIRLRHQREYGRLSSDGFDSGRFEFWPDVSMMQIKGFSPPKR